MAFLAGSTSGQQAKSFLLTLLTDSVQFFFARAAAELHLWRTISALPCFIGGSETSHTACGKKSLFPLTQEITIYIPSHVFFIIS